MASMYWRVVWKKKTDTQQKGKFEVLCTSERMADYYKRFFEKDPDVTSVEIIKELIYPKKN